LLAGIFGEGGFGIEGVDVTGAAVEEEEDDAFGFGGEMRSGKIADCGLRIAD